MIFLDHLLNNLFLRDDNIFYQSQFTTEIFGQGVLDFTKGNHATLRRSVSDHIPVWVEVDVSVDDD